MDLGLEQAVYFLIWRSAAAGASVPWQRGQSSTLPLGPSTRWHGQKCRDRSPPGSLPSAAAEAIWFQPAMAGVYLREILDLLLQLPVMGDPRLSRLIWRAAGLQGTRGSARGPSQTTQAPARRFPGRVKIMARP